MKILITGSAGFIGTHAMAAAKSRGWQTAQCDPRHTIGTSIDCRDLIAKAFERIGLAAESVASDIRKLRELAEKQESE